MPRTVLADSNFLVPNATFIVELVAFGVILAVLGRYVLPPINKALSERQERIRRQFEESEQAKAAAEAAEQRYLAQLADARHEAKGIREEAREQGAAIIAEMRQQAQQESARILEQGQAQLEAERQQVVAQLRTEMATLATALASRIVGESLEDDDRRRRTVERFLEGLEQEQPVDSQGAH
ncbi:MAG: F0F1 ATP synthase subunit B [Nocardioidaceae bacterium]|jgi:F-type H+-transporting ATPase subunit b